MKIVGNCRRCGAYAKLKDGLCKRCRKELEEEKKTEEKK